LHIVDAHTSPGQHGWPTPPQRTHVLVASQAYGSEHQSPPLLPSQHGWPLPPQLTHIDERHVVSGAVQLTASPQHGWPASPQPVQPLFVPHTPSVGPHEAPG
jgi:hypothetical protein